MTATARLTVCCAALMTALITVLGTLGSAQQFEKDTVNNMFGSESKVQIYEPKDVRKPDRAKSEAELEAERRQQQITFLETMCRNIGPKSSACTDLEELKAKKAAADSSGETWD